MSNSAHFRSQTNAILVGQQIGEKPNSYQEAREKKLANSRWTVRYSVKFYKFVENDENLLRPDQEIIPSWDDYKSARDPVLDWVLNTNSDAETSLVRFPATALSDHPLSSQILHDVPWSQSRGAAAVRSAW
jgi:hypothetical protein